MTGTLFFSFHLPLARVDVLQLNGRLGSCGLRQSHLQIGDDTGLPFHLLLQPSPPILPLLPIGAEEQRSLEAVCLPRRCVVRGVEGLL
jgi:hypothetical protein